VRRQVPRLERLGHRTRFRKLVERLPRDRFVQFVRHCFVEWHVLDGQFVGGWQFVRWWEFVGRQLVGKSDAERQVPVQ
jgi:hypothetical protein